MHMEATGRLWECVWDVWERFGDLAIWPFGGGRGRESSNGFQLEGGEGRR
jgi:hypothetical protein